jgi:hypothetical protein
MIASFVTNAWSRRLARIRDQQIARQVIAKKPIVIWRRRRASSRSTTAGAHNAVVRQDTANGTPARTTASTCDGSSSAAIPSQMDVPFRRA